MKVIKEPARPKRHRFACNHCRAELEAEPSDVSQWGDDVRDGSFAIIKCPVCRRSNYISERLLKGWKLAQRLGIKPQK